MADSLRFVWPPIVRSSVRTDRGRDGHAAMVVRRGLGAALLSMALVAGASTPARASALAADTLEAAARSALARGQPWQASRLLSVALADSARRTPTLLLLAAQAASAWGGTSETIRLLHEQPWLDREANGAGHALLAAAWLEQRRDTLARDAARTAVRTAATPRDRAERQVLLARAFDRLDQRDSAALAYRAAAAGLPAIADWLLLRAVGVTDDSAARTALSTSVMRPLARTRLPWMFAQALERMGDSAAAAHEYGLAGASLKVLALRLGAPSAGDSVRGVLVRLLGTSVAGDDARAAVALLRRIGGVTPAEQLLIARTLERSGEPAAAALAYAASKAAAKPEDLLAYADLLVRLGQNPEAIRQYKPLARNKKLGAAVTYRMARAYLRNDQVDVARRLLASVPVKWPRDTVPAAQALYLLGDLATDARADSAAVVQWARLAKRYPTSPLAAAARFRSGIALYALGDAAAAAAAFDSLTRRYPASNEILAARYWAGRAYALLGDTAAAGARWRAVISADRRSWYAALSEARLGVPPWRPEEVPDRFVPVPEVDSVLAIARLLDRLGLDPESRREVQAVVRAADGVDAVERLLAVANALRAAGFGSEAITVARRAVARQAEPDARTWRLLYPLAFAAALREEAAVRGVDPTFAAALIRQESMYEPAATSRAGARGLMQLMPEVGRLTARGLRYPQWDAALLWQPDVNLELGMTHLAELLQRYREPVRVLAAYNAGAGRVERWALKGGVEDPELFAERIPFTETRDYVRVIQRNQQFYRALYDWPSRPLHP